MKINFAEFAPPRSGAVVVGAWEDRVLTGSARQLDEATGGAVSRAVAAAPRFHGKKNELLRDHRPGQPVGQPHRRRRSRQARRGRRPAAAGSRRQPRGPSERRRRERGDLRDRSRRRRRRSSRPRRPRSSRSARAARLSLRQVPHQAEARAEAVARRRHRARATSPAPRRGVRALGATAEAISFTRDLVSEPANMLYPETLAEQAAVADRVRRRGRGARRRPHARTRHGRAARRRRRAASGRPRLVVMEHRGGKPDSPPVAFIGKGVTFDTGGISIKPAAGMDDMKWDMAGAGVVIGLMSRWPRARPRSTWSASSAWSRTCRRARRSARATS